MTSSVAVICQLKSRVYGVLSISMFVLKVPEDETLNKMKNLLQLYASETSGKLTTPVKLSSNCTILPRRRPDGSQTVSSYRLLPYFQYVNYQPVYSRHCHEVK